MKKFSYIIMLLLVTDPVLEWVIYPTLLHISENIVAYFFVIAGIFTIIRHKITRG